MVIRYKKINAYSGPHQDSKRARWDHQDWLRNLELEPFIIHLKHWKHPYELVKKHNKLFNDANMINQFRQTMHRIYQLQGTVDIHLRQELKDKIYGRLGDEKQEEKEDVDNDFKMSGNEQHINNDEFDYDFQRGIYAELIKLLKDCCKQCHPKYRCAMWGWTNPNINYNEWIYATVLDKVWQDKDETIIRYINIPFFTSGRSIDDCIKKEAGITDQHAPIWYYGITNYDFMCSFGISKHTYVFLFVLK